MKFSGKRLFLAFAISLTFGLFGCGVNHSATVAQSSSPAASQTGGGSGSQSGGGSGGSTGAGSVVISPSSASVVSGTSEQFSAQVTGESNIAVNWFVNGVQNGDSAVGMITTSGLYTAPACKPPARVAIKAESAADSSVSASVQVVIAAGSSSNTVACTGKVPHSSHVVLVIEENHSYANVYPSGMPWLVAEGNRFGFASNYHADAPGSALDYFWLSSGSGESAFGCQGWGCPNPITSDNIFREINNAGLSWKVYAESLPSIAYMADSASPYVKRHNPAPWYSDVINSLAQQKNMVPFTEFAADLAADRLPNYSIVVPDVNNDAHNGTLSQADSWLKTNIAPLLNDSFFQTDGLLIVTFDECDAAVGACPEQVYTAVIGPNVKPGIKSGTFYKHENALRTILDALGITVYPGASKDGAY